MPDLSNKEFIIVMALFLFIGSCGTYVEHKAELERCAERTGISYVR